MSLSVCATKVFYDTAFEAELAAARVEDRFGEEMMSYPCQNHWHITHKKREERRGLGNAYTRCQVCPNVVKKSKLSKHMLKHIREDDD